MYKARIIKADEIVPHTNADKLNLFRYNGLQFIVDKTVTKDQLMVIFFTDGQLSHEFCRENNLYRDASLNKDNTKSGYISDNRRVKAEKLRGELSYGLVMPVECLYYTGEKKFQLGMEFDTLNGHSICNKYITKATENAIKNRGGKKSHGDHVEYNLPEHFETENIQYYLDKLPQEGFLSVTVKIHGTSARTGYVKVEEHKQNWIQLILSSIFKKKFESVTEKYDYVSGTRRTILNNRGDINPDSADYYRWEIHNDLKKILRKGETLYYEIAGYDSHNSPIMNTQSTDSLKDKSFQQKFGKTIVYNYGCGEGSNPMREIYVYRITQETVDGREHELNWMEVKQRCKELGLKHVPEVFYMSYGKNSSTSLDIKTELTLPNTGLLDRLLQNQKSILGNHLEEGFCFRFEYPGGMVVYKAKNPYFLILEGVAKEKDIVDVEESN